MFELIRTLLLATIGISLILWWISSSSGWQELAEKYKTDRGLPSTFYSDPNQRISFYHEHKSGVSSIGTLGVGVLNEGLYLRVTSVPNILTFFPSLLIPWNDIFYRKITETNSSVQYFTFYLGNPRITRFSLNSSVIEKLEQDYGSAIFLEKLGEPS